MNPQESAARLQRIGSSTLSFVYDYVLRLSSGVYKGQGEDVPFPEEDRKRLVQSVLDYGGDDGELDAFLSELSATLRTPNDVLAASHFLRKVMAEHTLLTGLAAANERGRDELDE